MRYGARPRRAGPDGTPSLSAGFLAALPLFLAYELGLAARSDSPARVSAERVVAHVLSLFDDRLQSVRIALLLGLAVLAYAHLRRSGAAGPELWLDLGRAVVVGVVAGFLLGPILVGLHAWLGAEPLRLASPPPRSLAGSLWLVGAAPWEELLFRVGLYGGIFLLVRRTSAFLGLESRAARSGGELAALLGSALLFAWFHLESAQRLLGTSGESYQRGLFLWRVSAGLLLGALFRWRGFGVSAWAHAVFNLGIALGIQA